MTTLEEARNACMLAMNKLAKWRSIFAGWQLGTRTNGDSECAAVRDHREVTMFLRADTSTLIGLLIKKGVFTEQEFLEALTEEATLLDADYEGKFPGAKTTQYGVDIDVKKFAETTKDWRK